MELREFHRAFSEFCPSKIPIRVHYQCTAAAPKNSEAFNVVPEPRRRPNLDLLARGKKTVNDLVASLGLDRQQSPSTGEDTTMRACCDAAGDRKTATRALRVREVFAWTFPSAILVLEPKTIGAVLFIMRLTNRLSPPMSLCIPRGPSVGNGRH
jgi:hypothetical protein